MWNCWQPRLQLPLHDAGGHIAQLDPVAGRGQLLRAAARVQRVQHHRHGTAQARQVCCLHAAREKLLHACVEETARASAANAPDIVGTTEEWQPAKTSVAASR